MPDSTSPVPLSFRPSSPARRFRPLGHFAQHPALTSTPSREHLPPLSPARPRKNRRMSRARQAPENPLAASDPYQRRHSDHRDASPTPSMTSMHSAPPRTSLSVSGPSRPGTQDLDLEVAFTPSLHLVQQSPAPAIPVQALTGRHRPAPGHSATITARLLLFLYPSLRPPVIINIPAARPRSCTHTFLASAMPLIA
ncbi:hypothetical protein DL93DRAFT_2173707 [Clavulina sp. PMI_390]|nr:hypothetical protein DL93DRAFT_2173707 [Clavulina sp. PMI_390]